MLSVFIRGNYVLSYFVFIFFERTEHLYCKLRFGPFRFAFHNASILRLDVSRMRTFRSKISRSYAGKPFLL